MIDLLGALQRPICLHDRRQQTRSLGQVDINSIHLGGFASVVELFRPITGSVNNPASLGVPAAEAAFAVCQAQNTVLS